MSSPGFRIKKTIRRPDPALVALFAGLPAAVIGDNMKRTACMDARIRAMNRTPLLGVALTVRVRPGDSLMLHKAMDMAEPGDVIVLDGGGYTGCAVAGELMALWCRKRGLAGLVIDGCIRDYDSISALDFPVYAAGVNPNGPLREGGGEINFPVSCGGLAVHPGDIIAGDADGVVVVSPADAADVAAKARLQYKEEAGIIAGIKNGSWDRSWVDPLLTAKGCEFTD
ncbi:MAG: RraA family protein [Desulfovibrionaceae bacterium]|nr:RraA family protein [Desulfovibrionaceae bacterium]